MLKVSIGFLAAMWRSLSPPWLVWVGLLVLVNSVIPLFYLSTVEARVILTAFLLAGLIMILLFQAFGFVRLLGAGHLLAWTPAVAWLFTRLPAIEYDSTFGRWIIAVLVIDVIALLIDAIDVSRYAAGDREPFPARI